MKNRHIFFSAIVIAVATFGVLAYFDNPAGVNADFLAKLDEIGILTIKIRNSLPLGPSLRGLEAEISANNYSGASKIIDQSLAQNEKLTVRLAFLTLKFNELKELSANVADSAVKASAEKLFDVAMENNGRIINLTRYQKELLEATRKYYQILAAGKKMPMPDLNPIIEKIGSESTEILALRAKVAVAYQELKALLK